MPLTVVNNPQPGSESTAIATRGEIATHATASPR